MKLRHIEGEAEKVIRETLMASTIYTKPLSFTSQFPFCGLPLRLDSYAGCAFRCTYCFARYRGGNTYGETIRPVNPEVIKRFLHTAFESDKEKVGIIAQCLKRRMPVHFGGMSDPFHPAEIHYHITESILRLLAQYQYPTVISTRGALVASEPYLSLLHEIKNVVVQFSFSTSRDDIAHRIEPFSAPPTLLLRTMETLVRAGIIVTCRWQPYIPGISEPPAEFVPRITSTGCRHIALEHLKIPVERRAPLWKDLTKGVGRDLYDEYRRLGAHRDGREFILPAREKLATVLEAASVTRKQGLSFGAADNEFQYLSETACCCGIDQLPGFENWFKHQIGFAVRQCRGREITYETISEEWTPTGSIDRYLNSHSGLSHKNGSEGSVRDHILARWNNPKAHSSPTSFYGIESTPKTTTNGNRVYHWSISPVSNVKAEYI